MGTEILLSTGGIDPGNGYFAGAGTANNQEARVQQIVSVSGHITAFYCFINDNAAWTTTLRINGSNTTLTCTTSAVTGKGQTTGANVVLTAGDLLSLSFNGDLGGAGSWALTVGP